MDLRTELQDHLGIAYAVERELGGGGMSRVFLAHEQRLSRKVVIKVLPPDLVQGINAERFEREILLAASLQQANIVPVLSASDINGVPYFTMPFIEGESLRSRLGEGGLPIGDVVGILRDVTRALVYAHQRGVVHRDIKPDNVLLSGNTAVVTDFGIAKAISAARGGGDAAELARDLPVTALTSVGTSIGTPAYMAPEQVAGDPGVDHRADLYSLGCVAFELLAGRPPFAESNNQKVLTAHLTRTPAAIEGLRPDCPPVLARLIARLLEKDPDDRPQQAGEVLEALESVAITSTPTRAVSRPGMFARVLAGYAVALVAVVLVARWAVVGLGLPDWVFVGAVALMLMGLPVLLFTGWVKAASRGAALTGRYTPGGSEVEGRGTLATLALKAEPHLSMRRAIRVGIGVMAVFVLLVAGFVVTRAMGIGPAGSLLAAGTLDADDRLLLADFIVAPEDSAMGPIVVEAVRAAMSQSRSIRMVDPVDVGATLRRMQRPPDTRLSPEIAREVAARSGAGAILGGRLVRAGNGYLVSLELTAASTGSPLASFQGTADEVGDLLGVVDNLSRKLRGKVGESLRQVQRSVPLEQATTSSLEALRLYTEGSRANDIESDYNKAVRLLRAAVAVDSTFALGWRKLNAAMFNAGLPPMVRDSALERAVFYVDKLPVRERHLVMGAYYDQHTVHNDRGKALAEYRALYQLDSTERIAINQLAIIHAERHERDSAFRYNVREQVVSPNLPNALTIASQLVGLGRLDEATAMLDSLRRANPGIEATASYAGTMAILAYTRNDLATARQVLARAGPPGSQATDRLMVLTQLGTLDRIQGRFAAANEKSLELDRLLASLGWPGVSQIDLANTDIHVRGDPRAAVARLDAYVNGQEWRETQPQLRQYLMVALVYAEAGEPDKARRLLALQQEEDSLGWQSDVMRSFRTAVEGMILLAENRVDESLEKLRDARLGPDGAPNGCLACISFMTAQAHLAAGRPDSAVYWLEDYLALPPRERFPSDGAFLGTIRQRLGELYDQLGARDKAIEHFGAFVEQWADADAELQPAVRTARARLEELVRQEGS